MEQPLRCLQRKMLLMGLACPFDGVHPPNGKQVLDVRGLVSLAPRVRPCLPGLAGSCPPVATPSIYLHMIENILVCSFVLIRVLAR
jgi:hypothetical protein